MMLCLQLRRGTVIFNNVWSIKCSHKNVCFYSNSKPVNVIGNTWSFRKQPDKNDIRQLVWSTVKITVLQIYLNHKIDLGLDVRKQWETFDLFCIGNGFFLKNVFFCTKKAYLLKWARVLYRLFTTNFRHFVVLFAEHKGKKQRIIMSGEVHYCCRSSVMNLDIFNPFIKVAPFRGMSSQNHPSVLNY